MIRVALLGATGSIGASALALARTHPDRIRIVSLGARSREEALIEAARATGARRIALADPEAAARARARFDGEVLEGETGLAALAESPEADVVVNAMVGFAGLPATLAALERGKRVALANKESVVTAGELLRETALRTGGVILPVDSEHSGLFQCLAGLSTREVRRVTITASGGPFLRRDPADTRRVLHGVEGKASTTRYETIASAPNGSCSLVRCELVTGRMHQIRVHLASRGWPIAGDRVYGIASGQSPRFSRHALHAWRVTLAHPVTYARLIVEAPIPDDMRGVIEGFLSGSPQGRASPDGGGSLRSS